MAGAAQADWNNMVEDDLELRQMGAIDTTEKSGIRVPKKRKLLLILIDILTLITLILVIGLHNRLKVTC